VFQAIFSWSRLPMDLIETLFLNISQKLEQVLPPGFLSSLLVNGIIPGLSGVLIFLPQIIILFAFIAILEESGYMSRVSFIMDKMMRKFGLNGKSVVPLISGVACAVPAIMAARTIENKRDRLITIFVTPLMSCSARLPVFTLLISLVVPSEKVLGFLNLQGLVLMGMYLLGFVSALLLALCMKMLIRRGERDYMIMEMPVYKVPRLKSIIQNVSEAAKSFVWNAGKIIIAISIVLWFMASFGPGDRFERIEEKYRNEIASGNISEKEAELKMHSELLVNSYAGMVGKFIEPAIKPLGFDWKIGIALLSSVAAREVFVGTMSTLYSVGDDDENFNSVREKMHAEINPETGKPVFTMPVVLSLLIFYAFALQCISTIAVVRRETNGWKWPLIQFLLMTAMAYFSSLAVYQLLK
jgi:ferrous iron transport protein B